MKNFYIAVRCCVNGKYWAYVAHGNENCNFKYFLNDDRIISANIMPTKREAHNVVSAWNKSFKDSGVYQY